MPFYQPEQFQEPGTGNVDYIIGDDDSANTGDRIYSPPSAEDGSVKAVATTVTGSPNPIPAQSNPPYIVDGSSPYSNIK